MASDQSDVPEGSAFRPITVMSLTASVLPMAAFPLDVIDMILIAILEKAVLAAAIGYAGATLHSTSFARIGMASAGGARVAHALGSGDADPARRRSCTTLVQSPLLGCAVALLLGVDLPLSWPRRGRRGDGATAGLAVGAQRILIPTLPLVLIGMVGGTILRTMVMGAGPIGWPPSPTRS